MSEDEVIALMASVILAGSGVTPYRAVELAHEITDADLRWHLKDLVPVEKAMAMSLAVDHKLYARGARSWSKPRHKWEYHQPTDGQKRCVQCGHVEPMTSMNPAKPCARSLVK